MAGVGWILRTVVSGAEVDGFLESPWFFLTFGLVVGLPFTLPVVTDVWREQHPSRKVTAARQKPASRQDRLEFAKELERQVREYGGDSRTIDVELHGDKGTVLFFKGDLTREEGERLVAALRGDFKAGGFQRVEGQGEHGKWWVRVCGSAGGRADRRAVPAARRDGWKGDGARRARQRGGGGPPVGG